MNYFFYVREWFESKHRKRANYCGNRHSCVWVTMDSCCSDKKHDRLTILSVRFIRT